MNIGVRLFLSSAAFGITIAVVYWFSAHDITGTLLLGIMGVALCFASGYIIVAEREARLVGDRPDATNQEAAGERVGVYTLRSKWPFGIAVIVALFLIGVVFNAPLAVAGFIGLMVLLTMLIRESR